MGGKLAKEPSATVFSDTSTAACGSLDISGGILNLSTRPAHCMIK